MVVIFGVWKTKKHKEVGTVKAQLLNCERTNFYWEMEYRPFDLCSDKKKVYGLTLPCPELIGT